jgi:hypothetical protein
MNLILSVYQYALPYASFVGRDRSCRYSKGVLLYFELSIKLLSKVGNMRAYIEPSFMAQGPGSLGLLGLLPDPDDPPDLVT